MYSNTFMYPTLYKYHFQSRVFKDFISPMRCAGKPIVRICRNTSDQGDQKPTYNIHDIAGIRLLTKLRLNFSALNEHKFSHNFECLDPICACGTGKEDNKHFLLYCLSLNCSVEISLVSSGPSWR